MAQHKKYCSEIWNCLWDNNYVLRFYRIRFERTARLVEFGNFWHKSADQSSLEDQDKQHISFFVIRFTVKYCDLLVATAVLKVLDVLPRFWICSPVTAALWDPRAICENYALFWAPQNLFYITHNSSVRFLTLFKLMRNLDHQSFSFFCLINFLF